MTHKPARPCCAPARSRSHARHVFRPATSPPHVTQRKHCLAPGVHTHPRTIPGQRNSLSNSTPDPSTAARALCVQTPAHDTSKQAHSLALGISHATHQVASQRHRHQEFTRVRPLRPSHQGRASGCQRQLSDPPLPADVSENCPWCRERSRSHSCRQVSPRHITFTPLQGHHHTAQCEACGNYPHPQPPTTPSPPSPGRLQQLPLMLLHTCGSTPAPLPHSVRDHSCRHGQYQGRVDRRGWGR